MCEISALAQKIEQISKNFNTTLKKNDDRDTNMVENNVSFLPQELRSKDELIKSLSTLKQGFLSSVKWIDLAHCHKV